MSITALSHLLSISYSGLKDGEEPKNLLESVSESVNDELRLRNTYLVAENRILRNQITFMTGQKTMS